MLKQKVMTLLTLGSLVFAAACGDDDAKTDGPSLEDGGPDVTIVGDGPVRDLPDNDGPVQNDVGPQPDTQATADLPQGPSGKIYEARTAADGTVDITIEGVYVTYVKALHGDDPAGFFIQYEQAGPALFVAVDPSTLDPSPAKGDLITLTITAMDTNQGRREATAVSSISVTSRSNPLTSLVQDVTNAADLVSALDSYDAELIDLDGTVTGAFSNAGNGFVSADIDTGALTNNTSIKLRLPTNLQQSLALTAGCTFSLEATPLWRYNSQAQPSAWAEADIVVNSCPAPKVVSAIALSSTTVRVSFDRPLLASSVHANGDQFTFNNGLTASATSVNGSDVEVTTSAQTEGASYTVTVATTVTDADGTGVDTSANTADFLGYQAGAKLRINEINVDVLNGCDLLELRVIEGGALNGYKLLYRDAVALYFPPNMSVSKNDFIVVHFDSGDTQFCYANAVPDEVASNDKNMQPTAANTIPNFDGAWDLYSSTEGLAYTSAVVTIVDASDAIVDALFYSESGSSSPASSTLAAADVVAAANEWTPVGGSARTSYDATTFTEDAAKYTRNASGDRDYDSPSLQRANDADTNTKDDWATSSATPTWGALNPGQSNL